MGEGIAYHLACRSILATASDDFSVARRPVTQGTSMIPFRPSRRQMLCASVIGGITVYLAPLGSGAFASLFEQQLLTQAVVQEQQVPTDLDRVRPWPRRCAR